MSTSIDAGTRGDEAPGFGSVVRRPGPVRCGSRRLFALASSIGSVMLPGIALLATATWAADQVVSFEDRIVQVLVYPDRAAIDREASFDVPAGASTLRFSGLPHDLERDSLRVMAGGVPVVLGAIELAPTADAREESAAEMSARAEVERIRGELAQLDARDRTAAEQQRFVRSLSKNVGRSGAESGAGLSFDTSRIDQIYALIGDRLQELEEASLARSERRAQLDQALEIASARWEAAQTNASIRRLSASIEIETQFAGALTVHLQYVVPGAAWRPTYRATLDSDTGEVTLLGEAVIRQWTGEDWTDVPMHLSTASPARGIGPPQLSALVLGQKVTSAIEEITVTSRKREEGLSSLALTRRPRQLAPPVPLVPREDLSEQATMVRAEQVVTFRVPGRSTVPTDGRDHRVPLKNATLQSNLEYLTVPELNDAAFVFAQTQAPDYPLLAGALRVYAAGTYLGSIDLEEKAPGDPLRIPFGPDDRIRVERTRLPLRASSSGIFSRQQEVEYEIRTRIANRTREVRRIVLEDRMPISADSRLQVTMGAATTPGWRTNEQRPGIVEWPLEIDAGSTREIVLVYTLRFPPTVSVPRF